MDKSRKLTQKSTTLPACTALVNLDDILTFYFSTMKTGHIQRLKMLHEHCSGKTSAADPIHHNFFR